MTTGVIKTIKFRSFCFYLFLLLFTSSIQAQSDNYWSWNFNTPSMLMAGSVVGGSAGPSAIFYNPSVINHESIQSFSISANIVSLQSFKAENVAGEGINAEKLSFKVQPRFLSYVFSNKNKKIGMAAAILSPVSENLSFTIQHFDELDLIKRTEGLENYSGYLKYHRNYEDIYAGWGISYAVTDNLFLGASSFASIKLMNYDFRQYAQSYQLGDSVIVNQLPEARYITESKFDETFKYWDVSLILKLGALYKVLDDRISMGINITLPNIPLFGEGDVRKSLTRSNVYDNSTTEFTSNDIFVAEELKTSTRVKSPLSIAIGLQYSTKNKKNTISLTMEYFQAISSYAINSSQQKTYKMPKEWGDIINQNDVMHYYAQAESVTNFAIGFKQYVSSSLSILGGFRTNFTSGMRDNFKLNQGEFKINQIYIDKYHITIGPIAKIKNFLIVTGLQYSIGRDYKASQIVNFSNPIEYNPTSKTSLQGEKQNTTNLFFNELSVFLGITVGFGLE